MQLIRRIVVLPTLLLAICLAAPCLADEIVPVYPCRMLDTRNTTTGYLSPGTTLDFAVRAAPLSPAPGQGGQSGCSVPYNATGAVLHLVAIQPSGNGHVLMWPHGTPQPVASVLNVTALQTESTSTVALFAANGPAMDISVKNVGFSTYWVVDLVGYTVPSTATLVGHAIGTLSGGVLVVQTAGGISVKVFAPSSMPSFHDAWGAMIAEVVGSCVHIDGLWYPASSTVEYNTVEARGLPISVAGYCGPGESEDAPPSGRGATTTFQGAILTSQVIGSEAVVWEINGEVLPTVCTEPYIDPTECGSQPVTMTVCGTAHIATWVGGPHAAGPHLFINSLEACP